MYFSLKCGFISGAHTGLAAKPVPPPGLRSTWKAGPSQSIFYFLPRCLFPHFLANSYWNILFWQLSFFMKRIVKPEEKAILREKRMFPLICNLFHSASNLMCTWILIKRHFRSTAVLLIGEFNCSGCFFQVPQLCRALNLLPGKFIHEKKKTNPASLYKVKAFRNQKDVHTNAQFYHSR